MHRKSVCYKVTLRNKRKPAMTKGIVRDIEEVSPLSVKFAFTFLGKKTVTLYVGIYETIKRKTDQHCWLL